MARRLLFALLALALLAGPTVAVVMDGPTHAGAVVDLDYPVSQRLKNTGGSDGPRGPGSGSGLCVFTSATHAARLSGIECLYDFQQWCTHYPGGGYPEKLAKQVKKKWQEECQKAKSAGKPEPPEPVLYQYEGDDITVVRRVIESGRMACVTYDGRDGFYGGHIEHMVNVVGFNDQWVIILDNNRIGEKQLVWCTHDEFKSRWIGVGGRRHQGWLAAFLAPGAAPMPPARAP